MPCVIDTAERDYPKTPLSRVEESRGVALVGAGARLPSTLNQRLDVRHRSEESQHAAIAAFEIWVDDRELGWLL
jgi:hypothetical protein